MSNIYFDGGKTFSNAPAEYSGNSICVGGYGIPIFGHETRKLVDGTWDGGFRVSYQAPNRRVKEFEPPSLFRVSEYNCYFGQSASGFMSWILDSGEIRETNTNFLLDFKTAPFRFGTMNLYCTKPYSNAAFIQLFYHYDEWTADHPSEILTDSFGDVIGFTGVFTFLHKAAEIWNRYQVTWTFYDYDLGENGVIHYPRQFSKMLAWPFYDSPSRYIENPNLPPFTGTVPELRYYPKFGTFFGSHTDSGNVYGQAADTGNLALLAPNIIDSYSPFRIYGADSVRLPLAYCKDTLLSAASGWDVMLHEQHFNQIHPSWPWVMPLASMTTLGDSTFAFADHSLPFAFLPVNLNGQYYFNPYVGGTSQGTGSPYENIPMPAMDLATSFQLNNLNTKPTGWISFNDYGEGSGLPYASGGGPLYDLVHQINSEIPFFTNIFAKQANEPQAYSGLVAIPIFQGLGIAISGEINLPRVEYINAHINFSTVEPKEVPININFAASPVSIPFTIKYTKGTGIQEFDFDWNFIAYPTGQLRLLFRNVNGTVIDYPGYFTGIFPPGVRHPLSGINCNFKMPFETGFTIPTGYPIGPVGFIFSDYQARSEPVNDYFYHLLGGVDISGRNLGSNPFDPISQDGNGTTNFMTIDRTVDVDGTLAFNDPFQPIEDFNVFHTNTQGMILALRTAWFFIQESGMFNALPSGGFNPKKLTVPAFPDLTMDATIEIDGINVPLVDNLGTFTYPFSRATALLNFTGE